MKRLLFALLAVPAALVTAADRNLPQVRSIYLLPMSFGLEQYLANQLVRSGQFQVVTDPQMADAVFTDKLGESLDTKWKEIYPKPEEKKEAKSDKLGEGQLQWNPRPGGFGRARGNVYLLDRPSRSVLWSAYELPKNSSPGELDKLAKRFVERLLKDREKTAGPPEARVVASPAPQPASPTPAQQPAPAAAPPAPAPQPAPAAPKPPSL